jgi:hypothetical protein
MLNIQKISGIITITFLALVCQAKVKNKVFIYPAPEGEVLATNYTVSVEQKTVPVYIAKVASADSTRRFKAMDDHINSAQYFDQATFAYFDFQGRVDVCITCPQPVLQAKILPTAYGIVPVIKRHQIRFTLEQARNLTIEINGSCINALHLFANPMEMDAPRPDDPNVIYYGPGIHEVDNVQVASGQTVYVAGGAVVRATTNSGTAKGAAFILRGNNIKFRGRGILDGDMCPTHSRQLLSVSGTNILLEGLILRNSPLWTVAVRRSEDVKIRDLKLIGYRANSDGIDICNSHNVDVSDCFIRTLDDLIVIKSDRNQGESRHITVHDCVLWNEVAHALSIGAELQENVDDVRFSNCDIIHDKGREWTLRVFHCDSARISHVVFENIRIEESNKLMSLWIGKAIWSRDQERGHIEDVIFRNIQASGNHPVVEFKGFDASHPISNVTCERVTINRQPLQASEINRNAFVQNISVTP